MRSVLRIDWSRSAHYSVATRTITHVHSRTSRPDSTTEGVSITNIAGPRVSEYMHRQLEIVPQDATALDAAQRMRDQRVGSVFVESLDREQRDCRLAGIVTETDLITKLLAQGREADTTLASDIMSSPFLTITPDRPMIDASHLMESRRVGHLGVSDGTDIVGIISVPDLARYFTEATSGAVQALNDVYRPLTVLMR